MTRSIDHPLQHADRSEQAWLTAAQQRVLNHQPGAALQLLDEALLANPGSIDLLYAAAGLRSNVGDKGQAQLQLQRVLERSPDHPGAALLLARLLVEEGRTLHAAQVLERQFDDMAGDPERVIQVVELLDDAGRKREASRLCEAAIQATPEDVRLHAYAAMLLAQLGAFDLARQRYLYVAGHTDRAPDWHVPVGLAALQRYESTQHPDLVLFQHYLNQPLSDAARASVLFALGKAHDDLGRPEPAAACFRQANAMARAAQPWSRKRWRRRIETRRQRHLRSIVLPVADEWVPVFIVGMPRSGSTLLAELLARHPQVFHRGESPCLPILAARIDLQAADYPEQLAQARDTYTAQMRQDDNQARWIIDKQPSNYLEVDLILAMFPRARIIHCQRSPRDNALSIWTQSFLSESQGFAYDWADIAAVLHGGDQLMRHWQQRFPDAVRTVRYEALVENSDKCIDSLTAWLELPALAAPSGGSSEVISTASLWQARQPVHARSVARWRLYAPYIPELLQLPEQ